VYDEPSAFEIEDEQEKLVIPPLSKKESSICDKLDVLISMDEGGQTFV